MGVLFELFYSFLKIGFTSFGGLSMIPLINSEMLSHQWMSSGEVADIVAIAEMTPGPLGLNCATFAGIRVAGIPGALCANIGVLFPSFSVALIVGFGFEKCKKSPWLRRMLYGIRPVCIGMILNAMLSLGSTNYMREGIPCLQSMIIGFLSMGLLIKRKWNIPSVILLSAGLGMLLMNP